MHGADKPPERRPRVPGGNSKSWMLRYDRVAAPMGPTPSGDSPSSAIVYHFARGANVLDVDDNVYVDLAAGFGSMLLGHGHPSILRTIEVQAGRLLQSMGDVHPSVAKVALCERLSGLSDDPSRKYQVILGQSGADAVTAALKTAAALTGRPGVVAFGDSYHGLSYGPLAASGFRESYRRPFLDQLNPHVEFLDFPKSASDAERVLHEVRECLVAGEIGAVLVEPILGRGGVVVPPDPFVEELVSAAHESGALVIADEIWTGLGRAGSWLRSDAANPDLICLGKGLGGGLPMSACLGTPDVMSAWRRPEELVHTSTFAGAPLACATSIATIDTLRREHLIERASELGDRFRGSLEAALSDISDFAEVRGAGMMIGIDLGARPGAAARAATALLTRGYIVSTGGTGREVIVLTPPLTIAEPLVEGAVAALAEVLREGAP